MKRPVAGTESNPRRAEKSARTNPPSGAPADPASEAAPFPGTESNTARAEKPTRMNARQVERPQTRRRVKRSVAGTESNTARAEKSARTNPPSRATADPAPSEAPRCRHRVEPQARREARPHERRRVERPQTRRAE